MKILKIIGGIIGIVAIGVVGVGFALPDNCHMERTIEINAPACNVHAVVHQIHRFNEYSAWAKKDPSATYVFEGPDVGVGAKMSWSGNEKSVGKGSITLAKDEPCTAVETDLDFGVDVAKANWRIEDKGGKSVVVYGFDGDAKGNLMGRYFNLMIDDFLGPDYEETLAGLKRVVEAGPGDDIAGVSVSLIEAVPMPYACVALATSKDPAAIGAALGPAFGQIMGALGAAGIASTGPVIVVTLAETPEGFNLRAGIPIASLPPAPFADPAVESGDTPAGRVAMYAYTGSYDGLPVAHGKMNAWLGIHKFKAGSPSWEEFVNDPGNTPEAELITNIYYPLE